MRWTWRICAVLEQDGRDEQPVVGRLLDQRDDGGHALGRGREIGQARVVEAQGDLGGEVLELVAGQPELREDDQVGAVGPGRLERFVVAGEVRRRTARAPGRSGPARRGSAPWAEHTRPISARTSGRPVGSARAARRDGAVAQRDGAPRRC